MKTTACIVSKCGLAAGVVGVIALAAATLADPPARVGGGGGCPRDIGCPDVWNPVICSDGEIYSNGCYAYRACATGCVPWGDDRASGASVDPRR